MEYEQTEQSVNNAEFAEPQQIELQVETQEISENPSEVADPKPVQDAETNAQYAEMRRKQELDEYRSNLETTQQQLERVARLAGYESHDQMISQLDAIEQEQEAQRYREMGVDPEAFNTLIEQHPDIQFAREMKAKQEEEQRFQSEANELFSEFPDLKPEQIPAEVWQIKEQKGLSLLDSYLRVNYKNMGQQAEQQAIQKLQGNAVSSPGSLGGGDVNHVQSVSKLSSSDFNSLVDQVLRGERKQL